VSGWRFSADNRALAEDRTRNFKPSSGGQTIVDFGRLPGGHMKKRTCETGEQLPAEAARGERREIACECGRISEYERTDSAWIRVAELFPEAHQPLAGFGQDLKTGPDTQRFRFELVTSSGETLPVHLLYSASRREAEAKSGAMAAYRIRNVDSPAQARRRWVDWFLTPSRRRRAYALEGSGARP
jgi:hypothetical protein